MNAMHKYEETMNAIENIADVHDERRARLKEIEQKLFEGNTAGMAKRAKLDPSTLHRVLSGETHSVSTLVMKRVIANIADDRGMRVSQSWLEEGEGEMLVPTPPNNGNKTEPDELLEVKPDANGRDPVIVIWSDGKPWLAFYQDAAEDGTWILRSEVVGRLDMGVKRGKFKMESVSDAP